MNIGELLERRLSHAPDPVYLYFEDEQWTFREFHDRLNQAANAFLELGIGRGDRVCLMLPNGPEFLWAWWGLNKIGAIMVPINTGFKLPETLYIVEHCEAKGIVAQTENLAIALAAIEESRNLKWVASVGHPSGPKSLDLNRLWDRSSSRFQNPPLEDQDLASFIYTSGTTGPPKGVMHTHQTYVLCGQAMTLRADLSSQDRLMVVLPFFHGNAQFYSAMGSLAAGASLIIIPRFTASQFWHQAARYGATQFNFIGAIGRILMARPAEEFDPRHSIRVANGAPIPPDVYEAFTGRFGIPEVIDGYGLTECPGVCQNPIRGLKKMGSMGLPAKHPDPSIQLVEMKVVDEKDRELPCGSVGELVVRGPLVMKGYYREPQQTAEALRGGWLHTGDYCYQDGDGYFFFVDRKKDILRRRGENISSMEVEGVINAHPKVQESAVVPLPSSLSEDEVKAFIVLKEGEDLPPEEIITWCLGRLADFKVPRFLEYLKALPKTPSQKTAKYLLRNRISPPGLDMKDFIKKAAGKGRSPGT